MTFTQSIKVCFQKFAGFNGRAPRSEYWWFFLFTLIVRVVTGWIPGLGIVISLVILLPSLAVTVRRLHDTNRTGWWVLLPIGLALGGVIAGAVLTFAGLFGVGLALVVLGSIGGFLVLVGFLVQAGTPGNNQYGPNPLQSQSPASGPQGAYFDADLYQLPAEDPAQAGASQPQYCTQCGTQLQSDARFCTYCGTTV